VLAFMELWMYENVQIKCRIKLGDVAVISYYYITSFRNWVCPNNQCLNLVFCDQDWLEIAVWVQVSSTYWLSDLILSPTRIKKIEAEEAEDVALSLMLRRFCEKLIKVEIKRNQHQIVFERRSRLNTRSI